MPGAQAPPKHDTLASSLRVEWGLQTASFFKRLASAVVDVRRTADASRLSEGFRAKEPSVDPTRQVNMCVFLRGSLHCELAR